MFTKNWYKLFACCTLTESQSTHPFAAKSVSGTDRELYNNDSNANEVIEFYDISETILTTVTDGTWKGVAFGTDGTPPTPDDYRLAGNVISSLSGTVAKNVNIDEYGTTMTAIYTLTNSGAEDVTVREIGLFRQGYYSSLKYTSTFMLERTVLDEPVTIPAGGIGQVTYTIRMNYPTA